MREIRPIDIKRESGGMADIGTNEEGKIVQMIQIGKRHIIIKEKSIYELMMADDVDPERTNINMPDSIHKLILDKGSESEMISRVFLTANSLLTKGSFDESLDIEKSLNLTLNLVQELAVLDNEIKNYLTEEKQVSEDYESRRNQKISYSIPSIFNVKNRCTTIFQKVDHLEQTLMKIITIFYPNEGLTQQSHFPQLYNKIKAKYGEDDGFSRFLNHILDFMILVRNMRNALDHQLPGVNVYDFELLPNSDILTPSIELNFKESKLERQSLSEYLKNLFSQLVYICETTLVLLVNHNFKADLMAHEIREIPENQRRNKFVKFSFWAPIGEGGFYNQ